MSSAIQAPARTRPSLSIGRRPGVRRDLADRLGNVAGDGEPDRVSQSARRFGEPSEEAGFQREPAPVCAGRRAAAPAPVSPPGYGGRRCWIPGVTAVISPPSASGASAPASCQARARVGGPGLRDGLQCGRGVLGEAADQPEITGSKATGPDSARLGAQGGGIGQAVAAQCHRHGQIQHDVARLMHSARRPHRSNPSASPVTGAVSAAIPPRRGTRWPCPRRRRRTWLAGCILHAQSAFD